MSVEQERGQALMQIVTDITEELNTMIADPELDFDLGSALMVTGRVFTLTLASIPDDPDGNYKINAIGYWLEDTLGLMFPESEDLFAIAERHMKALQDAMLDGAVPAEGPGKGN